jgi:hypothetical protein
MLYQEKSDNLEFGNRRFDSDSAIRSGVGQSVQTCFRVPVSERGAGQRGAGLLESLQAKVVWTARGN